MPLPAAVAQAAVLRVPRLMLVPLLLLARREAVAVLELVPGVARAVAALPPSEPTDSRSLC